tara:strand:- start:1124 stop:1342 length:219 start_codon:yes stop_codon:yes gene_type:complete
MITQRALYMRVKRKLAAKGEALRTLRGTRHEKDLGQLYITDLYTGTVVATHVDLESLGRELGVLGETEKVSG